VEVVVHSHRVADPHGSPVGRTDSVGLPRPSPRAAPVGLQRDRTHLVDRHHDGRVVFAAHKSPQPLDHLSELRVLAPLPDPHGLEAHRLLVEDLPQPLLRDRLDDPNITAELCSRSKVHGPKAYPCPFGEEGASSPSARRTGRVKVGGRRPTLFGSRSSGSIRLKSFMTRRSHASLKNTLVAIFGGENPWLECSTTRARRIRVGSRVGFIRRSTDSPSSAVTSLTTSIGGGVNTPPGNVRSPDTQETLRPISGRGTRQPGTLSCRLRCTICRRNRSRPRRRRREGMTLLVARPYPPSMHESESETIAPTPAKSRFGSLVRQILGLVRESPPTPADRAATRDFYRTRWPYLGVLSFVGIAVIAFVVILLLHSQNPTSFTTLVTAELLVGWGTALLATAAIGELYLSFIRRSADATPNLSLSFQERQLKGYDPMGRPKWSYKHLEDGVPQSPDWDSLVLRIDNVGPGTAADLWVATVTAGELPPASDGVPRNRLPRPKRVVRFLRMNDHLDVEWRTFSADYTPDRESVDRSRDFTSDAIIAGCNDLEGTTGDVQVIALQREDEASGIWTVLPPVESEELLWRLTKGASWAIYRRMGFGLARPWQRRTR
jgi:hypothetical protein